MPTLLGACGGSCGVQGTGTHWAGLAGSGTLSFPTTGSIRTGNACIEFAGTATSYRYADLVAGGLVAAATRIFVFRYYILFPSSLPSKDVLFTDMWNAAVNVIVGFAFNQASSTLECFTGTSAAGAFSFAGGGFTVSADTWYLVDIILRSDAASWTCNARVNGRSVTEASINNGSAANPGGLAIGVYGEGGTGAITVRFDDFTLSQTAADFPIGSGYVHHFTPTSDGTHNVAGADDFERTLTGTDITNATTDAYLLVDDVPLESAAGDWINLIAPPNSTDYVEVVFGPASGISTPTRAPRCVSFIIGHHSAGALGNNLRVALRDSNGGTQEDAINKSVAGTAMAWSRSGIAAHDIPGTTNDWTVTAFNNLRARCYTSDATPDPYVDGYMLEAEWAEHEFPNWPRTQHVPGTRINPPSFGRSW